MCFERLWIAEPAIAPCGVYGLTGVGSARGGDGVAVRVVAEIRDDVRGDVKPVGCYVCYQRVAGCACRERADIQRDIYISNCGGWRSSSIEDNVQVTIGVSVA